LDDYSNPSCVVISLFSRTMNLSHIKFITTYVFEMNTAKPFILPIFFLYLANYLIRVNF
jgi:hypothetical protein